MSGRSLAEPAFPDDDGLVDPTLAAALGDPARVYEVFAGVRVFVAVMAILGERATDGSDKSADMAAVFITGGDGRKALLVFSSVATLRTWNDTARPVPVWGAQAAEAALGEGVHTILLDLGQANFQEIEFRSAH
jgi:hypothetical protein